MQTTGGGAPPERKPFPAGASNPPAHGRSGGGRDQAHPALSKREREVLSLIALGATDRQIAHELVISRVTVSTHVAHILTKLGVPNRTAAAGLFVAGRA